MVLGSILKVEGAFEFSLRPRRSVVRGQRAGQGAVDLDKVSMGVMAVSDTGAGVEDLAVAGDLKLKTCNWRPVNWL